MDWMQILTIIAATVGSTYAFYMITERRIDKMETFHREDMKSMDSKWERLFEKFIIKEQSKG